MRSGAGIRVIAALLVVTFSVVALSAANPASAATAPSGAGETPANAEAVDRFTANPADILSRYPDAGFFMVKEMRELVLAKTELAKTLAGLSSKANADQLDAIGTALGQAARLKTSFEDGQQIQLAVIAVNNPTLTTAFLKMTGDVETAAVSSASSASSAALGGISSGAQGAIGQGNAGTSTRSTATSSSSAAGGAEGASPAAFSFAIPTPPSTPPTVPGPIPGVGLVGLLVAGGAWRLFARFRRNLSS